jgi:hypothetical protein
MRKSAWALLALAAMMMGTIGVLISACGESDPALAPSGAKVRIVGWETEKWEIRCSEETGLPAFCGQAFSDFMEKQCVADGAGTEEECEAWWFAYDETSSDYRLAKRAARLAISNTPGACGYNNSIVTAFVEKYTYGSAGDTESSETEGSTGGALGGEPMNDIELRFIAYDGEMYKLSDDPKLLPPLANPYVTRTDDRGKSEIKYRVPRPVACDFEYTYLLEADIGVSKAWVQIEFTVEEATEEDVTDDDDTTT